MIVSFADKETQRIFNRERSSKLPPDVQHRARRKLEVLNAAPTLEVLKLPPSNHLESLKGDRKGQHSIRVNEKWRICFVWADGQVLDVEIVDYH